MREEFEKLTRLRQMIESEEFQDIIVKPMQKKYKELHVNFFSDSIKHSWRKGGEREGIEDFFNILKKVNVDWKNLKYELDSQGK